MNTLVLLFYVLQWVQYFNQEEIFVLIFVIIIRSGVKGCIILMHLMKYEFNNNLRSQLELLILYVDSYN